MNKLALIVLLATVCLARAAEEHDDIELESQAAAAPTDSEETANLKGDNVIFHDFCLRTRDHVLNDIKTTTNSAAANVFTLLFNSAQDIGTDAMDAQKKATDRLGNQIVNPEAEVHSEGDSEVDNLIAEGQRKIQGNPQQPRSLFQAFVSAIQATGTAIARGVAGKIENFRRQVGLDMAVSAIEGACDKVYEYQQEFQRTLDETKGELVAQNPRLASVNLGQVDCVTSKRVLRLDGLCKFAKVAKGPLMSMLRTFTR